LITSAFEIEEHVSIPQLANSHLLHRGDLFSDIQLHIFLHRIWGNRTLGELTAVDDREHVFARKLKAIRSGFSRNSSLFALR
jgi:hypothetical protein